MEPNDLFINNYGRRDLTLVKGEGLYVWDSHGNRYIDCVMGIAVQALGHGAPEITLAIQNQLKDLTHVSNLFLTPPQIELARALIEATSYPKAFFCNSGTEANEALIKFVRKYWAMEGKPDKIEILTFSSSFHGRTFGSMSATGQSKIKQGFGPLLEGFRILDLEENINLEKVVGPQTAALLFEPIMGEGGVIEIPPDLLSQIAALQKNGLLILCDEIQTGLGRTGTFLAQENFPFQPDAVSLAKPLGGGLPLGAVLLRNELAKCIGPGDHGTTFGGNSLACSAGLALIRVLTQNGYLEDVSRRSALFRSKLEKFVNKHSHLGMRPALRGRGFLVGIHFPAKAKEFMSACKNKGLLVCTAGPDVVRLLPPLNLQEEQMDEILALMDKAVVE